MGLGRYQGKIEEGLRKMRTRINKPMKEKLIKELRRLQRELNSPRLMTYIPGDKSEQEQARQRERSSKLARFHEILSVLNSME